MRPVERGGDPDPIRTKYGQAKPDLEVRLGAYCSYCERKLSVSLAVEHIQPKDLYPERRLEWDNFLLACSNCNSIKGAQDIVLDDYYWPHKDNTARIFCYSAGSLVGVNDQLDDNQQSVVKSTLTLTGLDRRPGHPHLSSNDKRWRERQEVWDIAQDEHAELKGGDTVQKREKIVRNALNSGFWSVWMTVFADDVDMRHRFVLAFPGTCGDCFDGEMGLVSRPGGCL